MILSELLRQPAAQAIGWALIHFIWQGALIGVLTAAALIALRRSAADVRYVVATIALCLMLTMPAVTAVQSWGAAGGSRPDLQVGRADVGRAANDPRSPSVNVADDGPAAPIATSQYGRATDDISVRAATEAIADIARIEPWIPALLVAWMCGVAVLTLRLASGWLWVQRMKTHGTMAADDSWQHIAARLSRQLRIARPIRLLESTIVEVPTVIGCLKPVILLPASALAGLAPHQLEAILAHELAHVRRHDYLVNLLQTLVETLLFYHPVVWWLSRTIRTERENCCDDLAVNLCGNPYTYARALADLEGMRGPRPFVMAATGGSLLQRIRRVLGAPASHSGRPPGWLAGSAAIVLMVGVAAGAVWSEALRAGQERIQPPASTISLESRSVESRSIESRQIVPQAIDHVRIAPRATTRTTIDTIDTRAATQVVQVIRATTDVVRATTMDLVKSGNPLAVAVAPLVPQPIAPQRIAAALAPFNSSVARAMPTFAATARATLVETQTRQDRQRGNFIWSHNGDKLEVRYEGEIEFSDDDTDVRRLSPGGYLTIKDGGFPGGRTVEFRADASGTIQRRYWVGSTERSFEPEGRAWLAQALPRFIRQTALGAQARVARILKSKGAAGVLAEISAIEGSWAKRIYFTHLFGSGALDAATVRQALGQAGREIESDYELASLLINSTQRLLTDAATQKAYFDAARTIQSDYELRRVFSAALKSPVSGATLAGLLAASTGIESDYELATLLVQVAKLQPLDATTRPPFFAALATVGGAYERGRVLQSVARRTDASADTILALLRATAPMRGSYEKAQVLLTLASTHTITGRLRDAYIDAAENLGDYEQGRVLTALVKSERRR